MASFTILSLAFPILLTFLQLKYMAKNQVDPFQSHPRTMRVAIASLLLYCMLIGLHRRFSSHPQYRTYAHVFRSTRMLFSGLSLLLTASLFFADEVRPVLCAVCVLFCIADWAAHHI
nr:hypothetical protein A4A49_53696 [Ipomoea batatas]GMD79399.1 hypothetical protein A4A49_53696 [Ipomoea batatas]